MFQLEINKIIDTFIISLQKCILIALSHRIVRQSHPERVLTFKLKVKYKFIITRISLARIATYAPRALSTMITPGER
jgi:hypothetical protein